MFYRRQAILAALALASLPLLSACRRAEVASYVIPKEPDPAMPGPVDGGDGGAGAAAPAPGGDMANTAVPTAEGPQLTWTAPASWVPKAGSAMRKGSYDVPGAGGSAADLSITAFPGDVGGELANVNRWRGQVGLPPLSDGELDGAVERLRRNGLEFTLVDLAGRQSPQRILGAIVPFGGGTWFFKLTGPDAVVAAEKAEFAKFLASVRPASAP